jgi:hypothetical protein
LMCADTEHRPHSFPTTSLQASACCTLGLLSS